MDETRNPRAAEPESLPASNASGPAAGGTVDPHAGATGAVEPHPGATGAVEPHPGATGAEPAATAPPTYEAGVPQHGPAGTDPQPATPPTPAGPAGPDVPAAGLPMPGTPPAPDTPPGPTVPDVPAASAGPASPYARPATDGPYGSTTEHPYASPAAPGAPAAGYAAPAAGYPAPAGGPYAPAAGPFGPTTAAMGTIPPYGVATHPASTKPPHRGRLIAGLTAGALAIALFSGGAGAGIAVAFSDNGRSAAPVITRDVSAASAKSAPKGTVEAAASVIMPSVVTLQVTGASPDGSRTGEATGSGVVIRTDGYILTNNHVVAGAAENGTVTATFSDSRSTTAKIVGRDPSNDLAVVKVDGMSGLKAATFAESRSLKIGQTVLAAGAPLGLSGTVTEGIVSAVNRPVRTGDGSGQDAVIDAVQTDAAINPGNSGGPLVDLDGRVVGINSAIATVSGNNGFPGQSGQSGNIGLGFAIPADDAVRVSQQLIEKGSAQHATIGVTAQDAQNGAGASIVQVSSGSPAAKAGLRANDVITAVDDRRVTDVDSLVAAVRDHQPGDRVTVTYQRGGSTSKATVTLVGKTD